MFPPRSLQNRLLLSFLLSMMAILVMGGFVIYTVINRHLHAEHDVLLRDRLFFYETTMRLKPLREKDPASKDSIPSYNMAPAEWERIVANENPDLVEAWQEKRGTLIPPKSPSLINKPDLPRLKVAGDDVVFTDYTLWDGRPARLCSRVFVPKKTRPDLDEVKVQLVVGRDLQALQKTLDDVFWFVVKIGVAVMGGILVASLFIIRRGVRPVNSLTRQIEIMPLAEEGAHFSLPGAPTELQPVVGRLNALMDRVNDAIEHERQFANNAAHELRNPLAAIRSSIEVALSRVRKQEEYEATLESLWQSQQGMQRIVDHLLLLARLESGHRRSEFIAEPAVFGKMLKKSWLNCLELAEEKKLRVTWQVENADAEIMLPVSLTAIVFTNLMENAATYTPSGGEVRISAALRDGRCHMSVENTNPGLKPEQMEDTFAPFWRADPNASGHRGNAGIGLALCRRICLTLGGKIEASLTDGGMVRYAVEIPFTAKPGSAAG